MSLRVRRASAWRPAAIRGALCVVLLGVGGATVATGAEAVAGSRTPVVVLPITVQGQLPDTRRIELRAALETGLGRGGFTLVSPPAELRSCTTGPCQAQVARGVGAEYAVSMRVVVERRDYSITIDVVDAEGGDAPVAQTAERCEVCGFTEVAQVVDSQAAAIVARLEALALEPPVLVFDSVPPGAVIRVDEQVVGQTPFERVVEPGSHQVRADKSGYVSEQRTVEAVAGVRATVGFELEPVPRPDRRERLRVLGWVALGVGVAGVATGVPLLAIDGRENRVRCSGANVDPQGNCKYLYATGEAGIAVTVVGGVLLATGIGLVVGMRSGAGKRRTSAALGMGPWGAVLRGRF
ncbi:MAG: PEGA domain-containing protein [Myxococcota bacterium]